jgi:ferric-dicitrate binding protein FerR (iron transport regulator)
MNITREIVQDLLPLYAAGEASEESRAAVEEWLRTDPELARLVVELRDDFAPSPAAGVSRTSGHTALAVTKALLRRRSWLLALALLSTGIPMSIVWDGSGLRFFGSAQESDGTPNFIGFLKRHVPRDTMRFGSRNCVVSNVHGGFKKNP